jgi:hypothetical protein
MKQTRRGVSYLEYHTNQTTGVSELYHGIIFGKSEALSMFCIEARQNLIRSYVQTDRLPNRGPISWFKGHVIATGMAQGGFFSPFYLERIHCDLNPKLSAKESSLAIGPDVEKSMARLIFEKYVDISPLSSIGKLAKGNELLSPPSPGADEAILLEYETEKFVKRWAVHSIVHISDLRQAVEKSYSRLELEKDYVYRLLSAVRD